MLTRRELLFGMTAMVIGLTVFLVLGEIVLRFLPVVRTPLVVPVTTANPVFHYRPNRPYTFSRDWDLHLRNRGWVNNDGMVNDQDYQKEGGAPLLAVIGDSFIEALMVPYAATLQGRLAQALEGTMRVYSFGASGAPLSQYLIWSRVAVRDYGARKLIINVVDNDFDESLELFKQDFRGFWIYAPDTTGQLRLRLFEFRPSLARGLLKNSALARYLLINLHLKHVLSPRRPCPAAGPAAGAGRESVRTCNYLPTSEARIAASIDALNAFFRDLPEYTELSPENVLFTLDGFRYPADSARRAGSYFDQMRVAFRERAEALGYEVMDAEPLLLADFRRRALPFEDSRDRHWNATAHGVVAEGVLGSRLLSQVKRSGQE